MIYRKVCYIVEQDTPVPSSLIEKQHSLLSVKQAGVFCPADSDFPLFPRSWLKSESPGCRAVGAHVEAPVKQESTRASLLDLQEQSRGLGA